MTFKKKKLPLAPDLQNTSQVNHF